MLDDGSGSFERRRASSVTGILIELNKFELNSENRCLRVGTGDCYIWHRSYRIWSHLNVRCCGSVRQLHLRMHHLSKSGEGWILR